MTAKSVIERLRECIESDIAYWTEAQNTTTDEVLREHWYGRAAEARIILKKLNRWCEMMEE